MLNRLRKLWRDTGGVAAIEFALLLPVLVALLIGSLEVTFKIWQTQKAEKLAVTLSDVIAQSKAVTSGDLTQLTSAVDKIMDPFSFTTSNGRVIISSVYVKQGETDAKVNWQCSFPPSSGYSAASKIGTKGNNAALPSGFTMVPKDNVIIAEIFYEYEPIAPGIIFDNDPGDAKTAYNANFDIYRKAMFKPRLGTLIVDPGCT